MGRDLASVLAESGLRQRHAKTLAAVVEAEVIRPREREAWDQALRHVWELNDPAYTVITDTESIHPILTRRDVDQALAENPFAGEVE